MDFPGKALHTSCHCADSIDSYSWTWSYMKRRARAGLLSKKPGTELPHALISIVNRRNSFCTAHIIRLNTKHGPVYLN